MKKKRNDKGRVQQEASTGIAHVAAGIGIGILAGLAGTVVMTAAQMIEMKISGRKPSNTPYKAVKKPSASRRNQRRTRNSLPM